MRLYYSPGASSLAPHIMLRELGLAVDLVRVDLAHHVVPSTAQRFSDINPMGKVPVLALDDGTVLTEGVAILAYLAERATSEREPPRHRVIEALSFIATELHKGYAPMFDPEVPPAYKRRLAEDAKPIQRVASMIGEGTFLFGKEPSVADAYLFAILRLGRLAGLDFSLWPNIVAFLDRVADRASVREALSAEGLDATGRG